MKIIKSVGFGILMSLAAYSLQAHEYSDNGLRIDHPWARPTPPVEPINSAVYLTVKNDRDQDLRLVSAASSISQDVSLHRSKEVDGMVSMQALPDGVLIKAGETVVFEPMGLHIMLRDLERPLKDGDRYPLELSFDDGEVVELDIYVEQPAAEVVEEHHH